MKSRNEPRLCYLKKFTKISKTTGRLEKISAFFGAYKQNSSELRRLPILKGLEVVLCRKTYFNH
jgi:hypothetical protein